MCKSGNIYPQPRNQTEKNENKFEMNFINNPADPIIWNKKIETEPRTKRVYEILNYKLFTYK